MRVSIDLWRFLCIVAFITVADSFGGRGLNREPPKYAHGLNHNTCIVIFCFLMTGSGGTVLAHGVQASYPPTALYTYNGPLSTQHQATVLATAPVETTVLPVSGQVHQAGQRYAPMANPAAAAGGAFAAYQPILYWYPSPPMSPQNTFYLQSFPTTVVMKGLPSSVHAQDIVRFLDGVTEVIVIKISDV